MVGVGGKIPHKCKMAHCFHLLISYTASVESLNQCIRNDRSDCKEACLPTLGPLFHGSLRKKYFYPPHSLLHEKMGFFCRGAENHHCVGLALRRHNSPPFPPPTHPLPAPITFGWPITQMTPFSNKYEELSFFMKKQVPCQCCQEAQDSPPFCLPGRAGVRTPHAHMHHSV